jgi:hypothetical protein
MASETLFIFFSKFSRVCTQSMSQFQYISPHLQTVMIDIDNPQTRKSIQNLKVVKKVPCALLVNNQFNSADFYEGVDFFNLINRTIEMIQAKQTKEITQAAETPISEIFSTESKPAAPPARQPSPGKKVKKTVTIVEPIEDFEQESNVKFQPDVATSMMARMMPAGIKKGEGHENMKSSLPSAAKEPSFSDIGGIGVPVTGEYDDSEYEDKPKGMSPEEILGSGNGGSSARTEKSRSIRSSAEELMREREGMG